jgi:hypothetical protein
MIRKCLKCDKEFESTGNRNRICKECNLANITINKSIETTKVLTKTTKQHPE